MVMQIIYLVLAILGFALPYSQLVPFFVHHGFDLPLFWSRLFANRISTDFAFDLIVSSLVFGFFVFQEGKKRQMQFLWLYIVFNWVIGLSFALPVFLLVRSRSLASGLSRHVNNSTPNSVTKVRREAV